LDVTALIMAPGDSTSGSKVETWLAQPAEQASAGRTP
jgi:hypothetical protein